MSKHYFVFNVLILGLVMLGWPVAVLAQGVIMHSTVYTNTAGVTAASAAKPRPMQHLVDAKIVPPASLLRNNARPANFGKPGVTGWQGYTRAPGERGAVTPDAFGGSTDVTPVSPYTTAGAYAEYGGPTPTAATVAVTSYPWRPAGQLTFSINGAEYLCSGSLIGPGLLLTAAHCVFEYGAGSPAGFHTNYVFTPALADQQAVYGSWTVSAQFIPAVYYYGTDTCTGTVICANDFAILVLNPDANGQPLGNFIGYFNYGWNGYSYVTSYGNASLSHLTQLGYPLAFDSGTRMERTDGIGALVGFGNGLYNTVLGSAQTGGSSGGPWLVNFGAIPTLSSDATLGYAPVPNVVVGVTSWGYVQVGVNSQGASWFGQNAQFPAASYSDSNGVVRGGGNIGAMVAQACSYAPRQCP